MKFAVKRAMAPTIPAPKKAAWKKARACYWCGRRVVYGAGNEPTTASREHLVPRSTGGNGGQRNIVVACRECNSRRGSDMDWVPYADRAGAPASQRAHLGQIGRL